MQTGNIQPEIGLPSSSIEGKILYPYLHHCYRKTFSSPSSPRPFTGNYPGIEGMLIVADDDVYLFVHHVYVYKFIYLFVRWMCVCSSCTTIYWHVNLFCLLLYTNKFTMINYLFVAWKYLFVHAINFGDSHFLLFVLYNPVFTMFDCFCSLYIITVYQVYSFRVSK